MDKGRRWVCMRKKISGSKRRNRGKVRGQPMDVNLPFGEFMVARIVELQGQGRGFFVTRRGARLFFL